MAINSLSTGFRPGVCTSSTRPTAPYEGQQIYETDTDKTLVWTGSAWLYLSTPQTSEIGAWQTWTPTITPQAGTFTTVTTNWARYAVINELLIAQLKFTLTSVGSGAGTINVTLPTGITIDAQSRIAGSWREQAVNGLTGVYQGSGSSAVVLHRYDNGAVTVGGGAYSGSFFWELV